MREQDDLITFNPEQSQLLSDHYFVRAILYINVTLKSKRKSLVEILAKLIWTC